MIRAAVAGIVFLAFLTSACGSEESQPAEPAVSVASPSSTADEPTSTATPQNIMDLPDFAPLEPGAYFIDPDGDPSTPVRVVYEVPVEGWSQWIGALRSSKETEGQVGVSIITVTNLVRDGCRDHRPADPPVGPSIDDLAAALVDLAPFKVTSPPRHVTIDGYRGTRLELTVPDLPHAGKGSENGFTNAWTGTSRAGSMPQRARSMAIRAPATPKSSGSSTSKALAW